MRMLIHFVTATVLLTLCSTIEEVHGLIESERMAEYHERGHNWPPRPEDYTPSTPGWQKSNKRRIDQLRSIKDTGESYDAYMVTVHTALNCKNFTENGWGLTRAPQHIIDLLLESLHNGMEEQMIHPSYEARSKAIQITDKRPYFIEQPELNNYIVNSLLPLHEAWSGVKLVPNNAYGLRVYRDGSNLNMHVDKTSTHIISSILHVDHGDNDEPWPIIIEDFQGNTNEVNLESGDMLFYESSKCMHGRPKKMRGGWYSSLFIHYHPEDWDANKVNMDNHYRIPSTWNSYTPRRAGGIEHLTGIESSFVESECEDQWCALKSAVVSSGPGPGYGKVMSVGGVVKELENIPTEESFYTDEEYDL